MSHETPTSDADTEYWKGQEELGYPSDTAGHEASTPKPDKYNAVVDHENQKLLEDIKYKEEIAQQTGNVPMTPKQFQERYPRSNAGVYINMLQDADDEKSRALRGVAHAEGIAKEHYQQNKDQIMTNARIEMEADQRADAAREEAHKAIDESQELATH